MNNFLVFDRAYFRSTYAVAVLRCGTNASRVERERTYNEQSSMNECYEDAMRMFDPGEEQQRLEEETFGPCSFDEFTTRLMNDALVVPVASNKVSESNISCLPKTKNFIHTLRSAALDLNVFAPFINENEYSINTIFQDPILPVATVTNMMDCYKAIGRNNAFVYKRRRFYYKSTKMLYYNDNLCATHNVLPFEFCVNTSSEDRCSSLKADVILRADFDPRNVYAKPHLTVKTRIVRQKFNWNGVAITATGAIEHDISDDCEFSNETRSRLRPTKVADITFWYLQLDYKCVSYNFGVSFRKYVASNHDAAERDDNVRVECNIECESPDIDGETFYTLWYMLYCYYKFQYVKFHRRIRPMVELKDEDCDMLRAVVHMGYNDATYMKMSLKDDMYQTLRNMRLVSQHETSDILYTAEMERGRYNNYEEMNKMITELSRYMGMSIMCEVSSTDDKFESDATGTDDDRSSIEGFEAAVGGSEDAERRSTTRPETITMVRAKDFDKLQIIHVKM